MGGVADQRMPEQRARHPMAQSSPSSLSTGFTGAREVPLLSLTEVVVENILLLCL